MKFVKSAIIGALIGLALGGLLSIGVVGSHSTCEGAKGCLSCVKLSAGGCVDCLSYWATPIKPILYATCGFFDCADCAGYGGCVDGCTDGCIAGCDECAKGCGNCGTSKCDKGCTECANGCDECPKDCERTQEALSNAPDAKKKIKNYLIYLTIIGTIIGTVFGIACDIQEKKNRRREAEKAERERKYKIEEEERKRQQEAEEKRRQQEAEERERKRKQTAEEKWREMKDWLSK